MCQRPRCFIRGIHDHCDDFSIFQFSDGTIYGFQPAYIDEFIALSANTCQGCVFNALWRPAKEYWFIGTSWAAMLNEYEGTSWDWEFVNDEMIPPDP